MSKRDPILQAENSLPEAVDTNPVKPWERLPRESDNQWSYFLCYRDMAYPNGLDGDFNKRSIAALSASLGVGENYLYKLQSSFKWQMRAGAYDRMLDAAKTEARLSQAVKIQKRQERLLTKAETLVEVELEKALERAQKDAEEGVLHPRELASLLTLVLKWRRVISGQTTQNIGVQHQHLWDLNTLTLEQLEVLAEAEQKATTAAALGATDSGNRLPPPIPKEIIDVDSED